MYTTHKQPTALKQKKKYIPKLWIQSKPWKKYEIYLLCIFSLLKMFLFFLSNLFCDLIDKPTYSEDYYGDLDLKSIRKSELLAGITQTSSKTQPKPRPTAEKEA